MPHYTKDFISYVNGLRIEEEYYRIFGVEPVGKVMCPFHPNENTPAAKVYGNHIKCFVCQRNYSVFMLLRRHNPERLEELVRTAPMQGTVVAGPTAPTLVPPREALDFSHGITIELLDTIVNYGKS